MTGCSKSNTDFLCADCLPDFEISAEQIVDNSDTRTSIDANRNVIWSTDDRVSLFYGSTANAQYAVSTGAGTTKATFSALSAGSSGSSIATNVACYPYDAATVLTASPLALNVTLPAVQTYLADSFGRGANAMAAVTADVSDRALEFKNVLGALKLQLKGSATVKSIAISGNAGEKLSGATVVTPVFGGAPSVALSSSASTIVTLDCPEGVVLNASTATSFYIMLPPLSFDSGFSVTIVDSQGRSMTKSTQNAIAVERATITPMAQFTYVGKSPNVLFDDANFKAALLQLTVDGNTGSAKIDADLDGEISVDEAAAVTSITVNPYTSSIASLGGIEHFTNLTRLNCAGPGWSAADNKVLFGSITALDLSHNTKLDELYCDYNHLTSIDVSLCTALTTLSSAYNQLTEIDVTHNRALVSLNLLYNSITSIDLSKNVALSSLDVQFNQLSALDVSACTSLIALRCTYNNLTALDLSKNSSLLSLMCYNNLIVELDLSHTNLHNSYYGYPVDCSPMSTSGGQNVLSTVYLGSSQVIKYINGSGTYIRNENYVPSETQIVVGDPSSYFTLSQDQFEVAGVGGTFSLSVACGSTCSIGSMPEWITETTAASTRAITTTEHTFSVAANNTGAERTGVIVFRNSANVEKSVTVTQPVSTGVDFWKNKDFWHRSLAMRFTATWCAYCPNMSSGFYAAQSANPNKIEIVNMHTYSSNLEFSGTSTLVTQYGVTGYPSGYIDGRIEIENYSPSYIATLIDNARVETEANYPTVSGIAISSTLTGTTLSADVKLYVKKADSYKITALLLEDNIVGYQNGGGDNYVHSDIARVALTNVSGDSFTTSADNQIVEKTYSTTISGSYNSSNLHILVYVQRAYGSQTIIRTADYGNYYVDNCRSAAVGSSVPLHFADNTTLGF